MSSKMMRIRTITPLPMYISQLLSGIGNDPRCTREGLRET